jgi:hypothetical protein
LSLVPAKLFHIMQKILLLVSLLAIMSFGAADTSLSKKDRKDAISYFKETEKDLLREVKGLSAQQLTWKPADSVWSVADCIEHITLSEKNIFDWAMTTLEEPANPAKRAELKHDDEAIKKMMTDRSFKVKTREGFIPTGQFGNSDNTLAIFKERRKAAIRYIKDTKDDLRNHFATTPMGLVDSYQVLIFLAGHSRRHTLQIMELKAMPGFPKE